MRRAFFHLLPPIGTATREPGEACSALEQFLHVDARPTPAGPSAVIYKGAEIAHDSFQGPHCCQSDSRCVYRTPSLSQCVPINEDGGSDNAYDGLGDLALQVKSNATCAAKNTQCGGGKGLYNGPTKCCDPATSCVHLNKCAYYLPPLPPQNKRAA